MLTTCKYNDYSLDNNGNLLFCRTSTCVFVVIQLVFLLADNSLFCDIIGRFAKAESHTMNLHQQFQSTNSKFQSAKMAL